MTLRISHGAIASATQVATPPTPILHTEIFSTTGANNWQVPTDLIGTTINFQLYGAGGGGAFYINSNPQNLGNGGYGAYCAGTLSVTPGESLTVNVGNGGQGAQTSGVGGVGGATTGGDGGNCYTPSMPGGGGGGATSIYRSTTPLAVAGGGGGGGGGDNNVTGGNGGNGGATNGSNGTVANGNVDSCGKGGSSSNAGAGGNNNGDYGSNNNGGRGGSSSGGVGGGGGGGGYYGGGGGGGGTGGGGGGGSSYNSGTNTVTQNTPLSSDPNYISGRGQRGSYSGSTSSPASNGGHGMAIIKYYRPV